MPRDHPSKSAAYAPDDAHLTVEALEFLRTSEGRRLRESIARLAGTGTLTVSQIAALRKAFPAPAVRAGLTLQDIQAKARLKFPTIPFIWSPPEALEQATGAAVARHKAARFALRGPSRIYDLCAGIGGDALALADVAPTFAVDVSPLRTFCLRFNAQDRQPPPRFPLQTQTADVHELAREFQPSHWVHIDPARRSGGKRSPHYRDLIPGPQVVEEIFRRVAGGAMKLSPAVDFAELPAGHLELISHRGTVVQAVLWRGALADDHALRTATICRDHAQAFSYKARPTVAQLQDVQPGQLSQTTKAMLYELDGAFTRAALAAPFARDQGLAPLTSDGGYLLGEHAAPLESPALTPFRLLQILPYSERAVARALVLLASTSQCPAEPVEVKSRGGKAGLPGVETDHLQRSWTKACPCGLTVLLFPHVANGGIWAAVGQRL